MEPDPGQAPGLNGPNHGGFTLIEVIMVLALLAIALLIGLPRFIPEREQVRAAATEVQSALQKAQRTAVLQQHDVRVLFDEAAGMLTIHLDADNNGVVDSGEGTEAVVLPEGTTFGRGDVEALPWGNDPVSFPDGVITFHRDGSANVEGGVYLSTIPQARDGGTRAETRAVEVARSTGTVRCRMPAATGWRGSCQ